MENKLYLIYLYNFEKKTYIDQRIHFNNEKDAVNYCFMNNICINLLSKDLYFHIKYGKDLTEEDLNKMLKKYAVFYKETAFRILRRC